MEISGHSFIEINTQDAEKLGIKDGERVRVKSRRGEITSEARVSDKTNPGETWMPFHFPDGDVNWLTNAALDKFARIPEYKVCSCKVEKIADDEAYTVEGTYIDQKMVAKQRHAELKKQIAEIVAE